jgi:hypothetical protein
MRTFQVRAVPGGWPVTPAWLGAVLRIRRLVLTCSMEPACVVHARLEAVLWIRHLVLACSMEQHARVFTKIRLGFLRAR